MAVFFLRSCKIILKFNYCLIPALGPNNSETTVPVETLAPGDRVRIPAGERIPADGVVIAGHSAVDQAPITGESVPVEKTINDDVYAGCINGEGMLTVEVTRNSTDNTLNRIIQLVEDAQSTRSPTQRIVDRFAALYTPIIVVIAAMVALLPPLLAGAPVLSQGDTVGWLYRALTILVIACPCALVISTPVTVISAVTSAAKRGVLIKGGAYLEALAGVTAVAFDKTGTLTYGRPEVMLVRDVNCQGAGCDDCQDLLALATAVERQSTHPLADAVSRAAMTQGVYDRYAPAADVRTLTGHGVAGVVAGRPVTVASHRYFDQHFPHTDALCQQVNDAETAGQTAMLVHNGERVSGMITVADSLRADSRDVIDQLHALDLKTIMLTGDNRTVAQSIAAQAGVSDYRAELLPDDKLTAVQTLQANGETVVMVGDGINDAPALAAAQVGMAMGGAGSAQALETADIALMQDDIAQLPYVVRLARFTRRLIRQNIVLTFAVKAVFLVLAVFGLASMWVAVFADVGMALLVTLNGLRSRNAC